MSTPITDPAVSPLGKRGALRGSPAGTDAGGTRHGGRLGARSEHPPTGPLTTPSVGVEKSALYHELRNTQSAGGSRVVVRLARGVPGSLVGVP